MFFKGFTLDLLWLIFIWSLFVQVDNILLCLQCTGVCIHTRTLSPSPHLFFPSSPILFSPHFFLGGGGGGGTGSHSFCVFRIAASMC